MSVVGNEIWSLSYSVLVFKFKAFPWASGKIYCHIPSRGRDHGRTERFEAKTCSWTEQPDSGDTFAGWHHTKDVGTDIAPCALLLCQKMSVGTRVR
ncbi:hypothetical protein ABID12_000439 [Martelella mangrovi]|uniref:Uncharacterized protein n=1 Tax=Martelella mangrovi TaxID=1397477 RepID=A0ABV2I7S8_9HYPH